MRAADQRERLLLWCVAIAMFAYIFARAVWVPLVHDEARMFRFYIDTGVVLPPNALLDAGNHILVSLTSYWATLIFGKSAWAIRLFSVLSYLLFAYGVVRLIGLMDSRMVRLCVGIALLTMPFLYEHFSLFRGYGPAVAFEVIGIYWLVRFMEDGNKRSLVWMVLSMSLAIFSCLTVVLVCCSAFALAFLRLIMVPTKRRAAPFFILALSSVPILLMAKFGSMLKDAGRLYWGGEEGFVHDTVGSLASRVIGFNSTWISWSLALLVCIAIAWGFFYFLWRKTDPSRVPLVVLAIVLLAVCSGTVLVAWVMDTPWPIDRTALHFIPIIVLLCAFGMDRAATLLPKMKWAALALLFFPLRTIITANTTHAMVWSDQALLPELYDRVNEAQARSDRPLVINASEFLNEVWDLGRRLRHEDPLCLDAIGNPQPICDLMITDPWLVGPPSGFHEIYRSPTQRAILWERDEPLLTIIALDTVLQFPRTDQEYIELWRSDTTNAPVSQPYLVSIDMEVTAADPSMLLLFTETRSADNAFHESNRVQLSAMYPTMDKQHIRMVRRVPAWPGKRAGTVVFMHNPDRMHMEVPRAVVKVLAVDQ